MLDGIDAPEPQVIEVTPPEAHSKKQRLLMQAFKTPDVREIWVAAGTKFGKSIGLSVGMAVAGLSRPRAKWRWTAPIYDQAEIGLEYVRRILPNDPKIVEVNRSRMTISLPDLDSVVRFAHAQDPHSLEGFGIAGDVFDECAKISRAAYDAAKTTRTVTGGAFVGASTPLGKNWFYTRCMDAKDRMEWAIRKGKPVTHIFITAPSTDNPLVSREAVEEARRDMPSRLYRQYYLAEFIDDGTVFAGFRECIRGEELDVYGERQRWIHPDARERSVVLGADWARTVDWTVFWAIDYEARPRPKVVGFERFHKRPYTEAVKKLGWFGKEFASVAGGYHDKTGVGVAIDEMCEQLPFPLEGITLTNQSKAELVARLISRVELRDLELPNWPQASRELDAFEVKTNDIGKMSYSAPQGQHDDCVMALVLGNAALSEFAGTTDVLVLGGGEKKGRRGEEDDPDDQAEQAAQEKAEEPSAMEAFYRDLAEDVDDD